jgi:integrase
MGGERCALVKRLHALGLVDYPLHDCRHHWAERMVRARMPLELVARQLGHRDIVMVANVNSLSHGSHFELDSRSLRACQLIEIPD